MSRLLLEKGKQKDFLTKAYRRSISGWRQIANVANVCERTLRDWRREKYNMSYESACSINKVLSIPMPKGVKILPEHWSTVKAGKIGGTRCYELHGNIGTPEGRHKGGKTTQRPFQLNPNYAQRKGFIIRKKIHYPAKSELLAEFIGIVLGDGSISKPQVTISMNSKTDVSYGSFISKLILKLFKVNPRVNMTKKNTLQVVATSRNLIEFLLRNGLKKGDKVRQQIDIPEWIKQKKNFKKSCLRGLIDTDGGIYFHTHITKGIKYRHMGLCFTNHSMPLLVSVYNILVELGINAKSNKKSHVSIYDRKEIEKYMIIVGSHNNKHINRFKSYKNSKT